MKQSKAKYYSSSSGEDDDEGDTRRKPRKSADNDEEANDDEEEGGGAYGTMVITNNSDDEGTGDDGDGSGTLKKTRSGSAAKGYVPPFLSHLQRASSDSAGAAAAGKIPKDFSEYSVSELKNMLKELDSNLEKEIEAIKQKYAETKKLIAAALQRK